ncbi:Heme-binding-like protein [Diplonema papillatum]|nr:Heme-binding-like protein [Diplonema papillatum]
MLRTVVACAVLSLAESAWVAPWFCHGLNCPEYVMEKNMTFGNQTVEMRQYTAQQMWTSTTVMSTSLTEADNVGFQRLFDYISGDNQGSVSVPMTCPVREYIQPGAGPNCNSTFTVAFYVPYKYQSALNASATTPPKPAKSDVSTTVDEKPLRVAVLGFPGMAPQDVVIQRVAELYTYLSTTNLKYDEENWFFSSYDPPFRIVNRHQEVWVQLFD